MENMGSALDGGAGHSQRNGLEDKLSSKVEAPETKLEKNENVASEISDEFVDKK